MPHLPHNWHGSPRRNWDLRSEPDPRSRTWVSRRQAHHGWRRRLLSCCQCVSVVQVGWAVALPRMWNAQTTAYICSLGDVSPVLTHTQVSDFTFSSRHTILLYTNAKPDIRTGMTKLGVLVGMIQPKTCSKIP
ncbi:hypothetical protein PHLGIDRAFT_283701 [Phlebiopsis gigantea 11061_1 CR5-6]|uniref:Uncharacterized protein n=1 Tax=Phlebiopsis gigantea (strain 11061_1 CR5-6) TaxID=745531 RepID=A0A0C3NDS3_PHLG1|nr:hypothetical protein PHLGIDRAFT_283701 [Phlebiopsis gigantea 11061_1 CR5-6]